MINLYSLNLMTKKVVLISNKLYIFHISHYFFITLIIKKDNGLLIIFKIIHGFMQNYNKVLGKKHIKLTLYLNILNKCVKKYKYKIVNCYF